MNFMDGEGGRAGTTRDAGRRRGQYVVGGPRRHYPWANHIKQGVQGVFWCAGPETCRDRRWVACCVPIRSNIRRGRTRSLTRTRRLKNPRGRGPIDIAEADKGAESHHRNDLYSNTRGMGARPMAEAVVVLAAVMSSIACVGEGFRLRRRRWRGPGSAFLFFSDYWSQRGGAVGRVLGLFVAGLGSAARFFLPLVPLGLRSRLLLPWRRGGPRRPPWPSPPCTASLAASRGGGSGVEPWQRQHLFPRQPVGRSRNTPSAGKEAFSRSPSNSEPSIPKKGRRRLAVAVGHGVSSPPRFRISSSNLDMRRDR